jgi:hypothetical protein
MIEFFVRVFVFVDSLSTSVRLFRAIESHRTPRKTSFVRLVKDTLNRRDFRMAYRGPGISLRLAIVHRNRALLSYGNTNVNVRLDKRRFV